MNRLALPFLLSTLAGCQITGFEGSRRVSDPEMASLVRSAPYPDLVPSVAAEPPPGLGPGPDGRPLAKLTLREAIRLSLRNNQNWLASAEAYDLQLLTLQVIRHGWDPLAQPLSGSVTWTHSPETGKSGAQSLSAGLTQKLPMGGSASLSWNPSGSQAAGPNSYAGTASVSATLPLLKGAGARSAWEELVLAERTAVYARRDLAYRRLDLMVQTVQGFYGLFQQERSLQNFERNLERARALLRQSELQFRFGRVTQTDVFRAQLQVTGAENQLSTSREQLRQARYAFKLDLGIPPEAELELIVEPIEYRALEVDADDAVASALATNPQWLNARDGTEDARRKLALADNDTLPQIDLTASYAWSPEPETRPFAGFDTDTRTFSVTGAFTIPLDRLSLRRDYHAAVLAARQAERGLERTRDAIVRQTQGRLIELRQAETTMNLQRRAITEAERAVRLVEIDYRRGRVRNREVIDAQDRLLDAQNQYQAALVAAKVAQLRLLQWIGRLQPDEDGAWLK